MSGIGWPATCPIPSNEENTCFITQIPPALGYTTHFKILYRGHKSLGTLRLCVLVTITYTLTHEEPKFRLLIHVYSLEQ